METTLLFVGIAIFVGILALGYLILKNSRNSGTYDNENLIRQNSELEIKLDSLLSEKSKLETEYELIKSKRDEFIGKNKQMFVELEQHKNNLQNSRERIAELQSQIAKFREQETRRQKEFESQTNNIENARKSLEQERKRIIREDEEQQQQILDEKNRIWNDHENDVLLKIREISKKNEIGFTMFDNTNLPVEFDGRLKPDAMIEFLGQYIVFDAKKSKSNYNNYILDQVKKSAEKFAQNDKIYSVAFFVIPQDALQSLKTLTYSELGFNFYVISIDALEPILANFKRITEYENIQNLDPQERENIVNLVAHYDRHISFQNAVNVLLAKDGVQLMNSKEKLTAELQNEINTKKQKIREKKITPNKLKQISNSLEEQTKEIDSLTIPREKIDSDDLLLAKKIITND